MAINSRYTFVFLMFVTLFYIQLLNAEIIYVNGAAAGNDDGTSWVHAFHDLQDAMAAATMSDAVWVAAGTYLPGTERTDSFTLKNGVAIYGGFKGDETSLDQRDVDGNATVLSGDLDQNDNSGGDNSENSYHVVVGSGTDETAILDGFIIRDGNANGSDADSNGGGMLIVGGSPTISNCIFMNNTANKLGGGMYNFDGSSPAILSCSFIENSAGVDGGAMNNEQSASPPISNCLFKDNVAMDDGGAMLNISESSPKIENCNFITNSAKDNAGGIGNISKSTSPQLVNCSFIGNSALGGGGVMFNFDNASPQLINCLIIGNSAVEDGGALVNHGSSASLTSCTIFGNTTESAGGAITNSNDSGLTIANSIIWGNTENPLRPGLEAQIKSTSESTSTIQHSLIQGWLKPEENGNLNGDPQFANELDPHGPDGILGTLDDGLQLLPLSPAIDAGDSDAVGYLATDLLENDRFDFPGIENTGSGDPAYADLGAYERQTDSIIPIIMEGSLILEGSQTDFQVKLGGAPVDTLTLEMELVSEDPDIALQTNSVLLFTPENWNMFQPVTLSAAEDDDAIDGVAVIRIKKNSGSNFVPDHEFNVSEHDNDLKLLVPDGGESWVIGTKQPIVWQTASAAVISIELSRDNGSNWEAILTSAVSGSGNYDWQVTGPPSAECLIRFFMDGNEMEKAISKSNFAIIPRSLRYVNNAATGNNNGTSWADAYTDLQDALHNSILGDDIWVAAGGYIPDAGESVISGDRTASFRLKSSVGVYGGFKGDETSLDQRDRVNNPTILSGDLNQNDDQEDGDTSENSYHVVDGSDTDETTILDGFIIRDGNADDSETHFGGGGMWINNGSPAISNCNFMNNSAIKGGGVFNTNEASPSISNCQFSHNTASDYGGGMVNEEMSNPKLIDCEIDSNTSMHEGSGMANFSSSPTLDRCNFMNNSTSGEVERADGAGVYNSRSSLTVSNCEFTNNSVNDSGGGMYNTNASQLIVRDCNFTGNISNDNGGGMLNFVNSTLDIVGCNFIENKAKDLGGGVHNDVGVFARLTNCRFEKNQSDFGGGLGNDNNSSAQLFECSFIGNTVGRIGGGIGNFDRSSSRLSNCVFVDNSATTFGGGLAVDGGGNPTRLANCTFTDNTAEIAGGGIHSKSSNIDLTNTILWNNNMEDTDNIIEAQITNSGTSESNITFSIIQGWETPGVGGNLNGDPQFANESDPDGSDDILGTPDDGLQLLPLSPAIDAGDSNAVGYLATDILENDRFDFPGVENTGSGDPAYADLGAYERQADSIIPIIMEGSFIPEGSQTDFQVKLGGAPVDTLALELELVSEDPDITLQTNSVLLFTQENWNIFQSVTLSAAEDDDAIDGVAVIRIKKISGSNFVPDQLNVSEKDNDLKLLVPDGGESWVIGTKRSIVWQAASAAVISIELSRDNGGSWQTILTSAVSASGSYDWQITGPPSAECLIRIFMDGNEMVNATSKFNFEIFPRSLRYVNHAAIGNNNGTSWTDAYTNLQDALRESSPGDDIWVAAGIYTPDIGEIITPGDRTASFQLKNGVTIYGGFKGNETSLVQRNVENSPSLLSGDLDQNDNSGGDNSENSYHVVVGSGTDETAILDGFIIQDGNANGSDVDSNGGGMLIVGGSPTISNCKFMNNTANKLGGGMYNFDGSSPTIVSCSFMENAAGVDGGAMNNEQSASPHISNCLFKDNVAMDDGGAILNISESSPRIENCNFITNSAKDNAGGIGNISMSSSPQIVNCSFIENSALGGGGVMFNFDNSSPQLVNCLLIGNSAVEDGGALVNHGSSASLTNCTIFGNTTESGGGGIMNSNDSDLIMANSIIWGNTGNPLRPILEAQIKSTLDSSSTIRHSLIQGWLTPGEKGNLNGDPQFVNELDPHGPDGILGTLDDGLQLLSLSPAIDAGDSEVVDYLATDLLENDRFDFPGVENTGSGDPAYADLGAYERQTDSIIPIIMEGSFILEGSQTDFQVKLGGAPVDTLALELELVSEDPDITLQTNSVLLFTPENWNVFQPVTLSAAEDDDAIDGIAVIGIKKLSGSNFVPDHEFNVSEQDNDLKLLVPDGGESWVIGTKHSIVWQAASSVVISIELSRDNGSSWEAVLTSAVSGSGSYDWQITGPPSGECLIRIFIDGKEMENATSKSNFEIIPRSLRYVNHAATGNKNGASWTDAYTNLQDALHESNPDDDIWVTAGIYTPDIGETIIPGDRTASFQLKNGVAIYGGFKGDEIGLDQRDSVTNPTILSGDLNQNDDQEDGDTSENSYHVVDGSSTDETTILDGFVIREGNADDSEIHFGGGGMWIDNGSPAISNCNFMKNSAIKGGGIFNTNQASPSLSNCQFSHNSASDYGGGIVNEKMSNPKLIDCDINFNTSMHEGSGMANFSSSPTIEHCRFMNNSTVGDVERADGGGMYNSRSSLTLLNCEFTNNSVHDSGGGIYNRWASQLILRDCNFNGNNANDNGGGMLNFQGPTLDISGCNFIENEATAGGGGIHNERGVFARLTNCRFEKNHSDNSGGGLRNDKDSSAQLFECSFIGNTAEGIGGGIGNFDRSSSQLSNCVFVDNSATTFGGGLAVDGGGNPNRLANCTFTDNTAEIAGGGIHSKSSNIDLTNTILWNNNKEDKDNIVEAQITNTGTSDTNITFSIIQGWETPGVEGNLDGDPLLTSDGHLTIGSPCIDAGIDLEAENPKDIDGENRPFGAHFDIGADEFVNTDNDGIPDWLELQISGNTDGVLPDEDNDKDGLSNIQEYIQATNPVNPDSDFDGRWDKDEDLAGTDPNNGDSIFAPFNPFSRFTTVEPNSLTTPLNSVLADLDGDQDLDLIISSITGGLVHYQNTGSIVNPVWASGLEFSAMGGQFSAGDADGDGDSDIVILGVNGLVFIENTIGPDVGDSIWAPPTPVGINLDNVVTPLTQIYMSDIVDVEGRYAKDGLDDIILVDGNGRMGLMANTGTQNNSQWASPDAHWAGSTVFVRPLKTLGDIDFDGDLDRLAGIDAEGIPVFETNIDEHLLIFPRYITIVQGESQKLEVEGGNGRVTFSLAQNTSRGAITDEGQYTAGVEGTGIDIIRGEAEDGLSGLVIVNVIAPEDADRTGKVLIVVGTRDVNDNLFSTSERLAMDAYVVCRQRGYLKNNICILTPNGDLSKTSHLGYDIDSRIESSSNLEQSITNWASDTDDLILYFVDHGVVRESKGNLVLRPGEYLPSNTLKLWLDAWQTQKAERTALVIIDTCYAGHFIDELAFGSDKRVVIASSESAKLAHFQAGGAISFSQLFWDEIAAGAETQKAFLATVKDLADTLDQVPIIDSDGDGVSEASDNISTVPGIGLSDLLAGIQRPAVGKVMENASIDEVTATLWCGDVVSNNGIQKVIAYIVPPTLETEVEGGSALTNMANVELIDYIARRRIPKDDFEIWQNLPEKDPEEQSEKETKDLILSKEDKELLLASYTEIGGLFELNEGIALSDLQQLRAIEEELNYLPRYEVDWDEFNTPGQYRILFFAEDSWGMLSSVRTALITVEGPKKRAIIIEGHGVSSDIEHPWSSEELEKQAKTAQQSLHNRSFKAEDIRWFGLNQLPVDKNEIQRLIEEEGDFVSNIDELTIYLVGNSTPNGLLLANDTLLTPGELKDWLDGFQMKTPLDVEVGVIVESDYAGTFLSGLASPIHKRYTIASTSSTEQTLREDGLTFGDFFWGEIRRNRSIQRAIGNSIVFARAIGLHQQFELDDDQDGLYNKKKDGKWTANSFVGTPFITGDDDIRITDYSQLLVLNSENSGLVWVNELFSPDGSDLKVTMAIVDSVSGDILSSKPLVESTLTPGRYELELRADTFPQNGHFIGAIQAVSMNNSSFASIPVPVEIFVNTSLTSAESILDEGVARLAINSEERGKKLSSGGIDAYRFWAWKGQGLNVDLTEISNELDLRLSVYIQTQEGVVTLEQSDDWGLGLPEGIWNFQIPNSGWYYVSVESLTSPSTESSYSIALSAEQLNVPDDFEVDDSVEQANFITSLDGDTQVHNFHSENDTDWTKFMAGKDKAITIKANVGTASDINLSLEIYDRDGTTRLKTVNESGLGEGELGLFTPEIDGIYYLRVSDVNPQAFRLNTEYELTLFYEIGDLNGFPQGFVIDNTVNEPLPEFRIKVFNDNATFWDFTYSCDDLTIGCDEYNGECGKYDTPGFEKGDYLLEVSSVGYESEIVPITLEANTVTCHIVRLKPENSTPSTVFAIDVNDSYQLQFGQLTDATEDFDELYDKIYKPSDNGSANVYLFDRKILDSIKKPLLSDLRPVEDTTRWRLQIEIPDGGNQPAELSWEISPLDNDYRIYLQELDNELPIGVPVDMTKSKFLSVQSDSSFKIVYSQLLMEELILNPGLNLCSIPVVTLTTIGDLLNEDNHSSAIDWNSVWYWNDNQFKILSEGLPFTPERGYWVTNTGKESYTLEVSGIVTDGIITLQEGWNLIAPVADCPKPEKEEIIDNIWWWDSIKQSYKVLADNDLLKVGQGYWIYSSRECEMELNTVGHEIPHDP